MIEYSSEYNGYWQRPDRVGTSSFASPLPIVREILAVCGTGRLLDIGCGMGALVRMLLDMGVDAHGVDVSSVVVAAANRLAPGRFVSGSVLQLPFADRSFDAVISTDCLEHLAPEHVPQAFAEIRRVCKRHVYLKIATGPDRDNHWHLTIEGRAWWEQMAFSSGFRKHPAYYRVNPFEALEHDPYSVTIPLQRVEDEALAVAGSVGAADTDPAGSDMLRQTGRESDANLVRYQFAADHVLPGQTVVVLECGRGDGCAILSDSSPASRVIGVTGSKDDVHYARANYAGSLLEFVESDPASLPSIEASSVGTLIAFGLTRQRAGSPAFLDEAVRLLRPDGQLVMSLHGRGGDGPTDAGRANELPCANGQKLNPGSPRVLVVERVVGIFAGGRPDCPATERRMIEFSGAGSAASAQPDWWLIVARLTEGEVEPGTAHDSEQERANVTRLCATARATLNLARIDADERRSLIERLLASLDQATPRAASVAYLIGRLHQIGAEMDLARDCYDEAVRLVDPSCNGRTAADQVDAALRSGLISLGLGDHVAARNAWSRGIDCARLRLGSSGGELFDPCANDESPLESPALLVADGGRRCAIGLHLLHLADAKPGLVAAQITNSLGSTFDRMEEAAASREAAQRESLERLKTELANISHEHAKTLGSYSWMVTAPLRTLADFLRGWMR